MGQTVGIFSPQQEPRHVGSRQSPRAGSPDTLLRSFRLPDGGQLEIPRSVALVWAPAAGRLRAGDGPWQELGPTDYALAGPGSRLALGPADEEAEGRVDVLTVSASMLGEITAELRAVSRVPALQAEKVRNLPFRAGIHRQPAWLGPLLKDLDQAAALGMEDPAWLARHGRLVWERLLYRHGVSESGRPRTARASGGRPGVLAGRLARVRRMIEREYERPLSLEEMAGVACVSRFHFLREFRKAFGETPYQLLLRVRLETAKTLLARGDLSVQEVSQRVGFSSPDGFYRAFKRRYRRPPSEYRAGA